MADSMDLLAKVPLFMGLSKKDLSRLNKIAVKREFPAGTAIVTEGDEGAGFFLITEGEVEVTRGGTALNTLKAGDFFGEMALLDNHRRSATVKAVKDTTCLAMSRWDFVSELKANPELALSILEVMSRRVRELDQRLTV